LENLRNALKALDLGEDLMKEQDSVARGSMEVVVFG